MPLTSSVNNLASVSLSSDWSHGICCYIRESFQGQSESSHCSHNHRQAWLEGKSLWLGNVQSTSRVHKIRVFPGVLLKISLRAPSPLETSTHNAHLPVYPKQEFPLCLGQRGSCLGGRSQVTPLAADQILSHQSRTHQGPQPANPPQQLLVLGKLQAGMKTLRPCYRRKATKPVLGIAPLQPNCSRPQTLWLGESWQSLPQSWIM